MTNDPRWSRLTGRQHPRHGRPLTRTVRQRLALLVLAVTALALLVWPMLALAADPVPTPTRVRVDNRPSATPGPTRILLVSGPSEVTLPMRGDAAIKLHYLVRATDPVVNRIRLWLKTPDQDPAPHTPAYCAKMASNLRRKGVDEITCKLNWRAPRGTWSLCLFSPDEPDSAYPGLMEPCQQVEVH